MGIHRNALWPFDIQECWINRLHIDFWITPTWVITLLYSSKMGYHGQLNQTLGRVCVKFHVKRHEIFRFRQMKRKICGENIKEQYFTSLEHVSAISVSKRPTWNSNNNCNTRSLLRRILPYISTLTALYSPKLLNYPSLYLRNHSVNISTAPFFLDCI